ncbi:MAG: biotin--[acetyl-CoA-carboxylase] ligase [Dysgonamonadaceae bacterium]|jgi:BirA family biotin operon repressor/biotin-[acetyl-CoA-carboxylase] ligase|nr:biotin--[acetyl-CoA-carboxylase] ligase [Dysgonamonadaceae bacterium]
MKIIRVKTVDSTNRLMKELTGNPMTKTLEEGATLIADEQTAGRGQKGAFWEAESGKNLTCSMVFYPDFLALERHFLLSEVVALGVKEALDSVADGLQPFAIKWPNDIYYENRKIAGILIENDLMNRQIIRSIVGVGVNVNQEVFTSDAPNPVSLKLLLGKSVSLNELLEKMHQKIMQGYRKLKDEDFESISAAYHAALYRKTGFYLYKDKQGYFDAQIQSVSDDGFLYLQTAQGEVRRYAFKEVSPATSNEKNRELYRTRKPSTFES